jgi:hypothetical protein
MQELSIQPGTFVLSLHLVEPEAAGSKFAGWTVEGALVELPEPCGTETECTVESEGAPVTVKARFATIHKLTTADELRGLLQAWAPSVASLQITSSPGKGGDRRWPSVTRSPP